MTTGEVGSFWDIKIPFSEEVWGLSGFKCTLPDWGEEDPDPEEWVPVNKVDAA